MKVVTQKGSTIYGLRNFVDGGDYPAITRRQNIDSRSAVQYIGQLMEGGSEVQRLILILGFIRDGIFARTPSH